MAFPQIASADTQSGTVTSNASIWNLTYPTNLAAGDLIFGALALDGATGISASWSGFVNAKRNPGAVSLWVGKRVSDGTESGTFSVDLDAAEQGSWRVFRIPAATWEGTLGTTFENVAASGSVVMFPANAASSTPDPPLLTPNNWGAEDTLWFALAGVDTSRTVSVFPLPDNQTSQVSGGSGGATLAICTQNLNASSLNPGTFTISASDDWIAFTIGIRPSAGGGGGGATPLDDFGMAGFFGL